MPGVLVIEAVLPVASYVYEVTLVPVLLVSVEAISACGPPVPPPVFGSVDGVLGPDPKVWVTVVSLAALPVTSFFTSLVRLPILSYSYCCQYGAGPPTLGLPVPSTLGPVALEQPPMPRTLGWGAVVVVPVSVQACVSRPR
ncbi:hypothetical protein SAVIM40S_07858 [Streptomyces avidinii]